MEIALDNTEPIKNIPDDFRNLTSGDSLVFI